MLRPSRTQGLPGCPGDRASLLAPSFGLGRAGGRWERGGSCGLGSGFAVRRDVPPPAPRPERGLRRCVGGPLGRRSSRCLGKYGQDSARKQILPSLFSQVAGQKMNSKIKQLFWSTHRGRTRLCFSHGSGSQRGPRRRRPGGTFRWSGDTLDPCKSWARWPRGIHGFRKAWPAVQTSTLWRWATDRLAVCTRKEGSCLGKGASRQELQPSICRRDVFFFPPLLGQRNRQTRSCLIR